MIRSALFVLSALWEQGPQVARLVTESPAPSFCPTACRMDVIHIGLQVEMGEVKVPVLAESSLVLWLEKLSGRTGA